jgi:hypothetical protein
MNSRFRALAPLLLTVVLAPALLARPQQGGVDKSLFVSVLDENGRPVRQFTADDILIREDGQDRQVVAVKPASQPISVAFLIDTAQGKRVTDAYGTPEEYVRDMRVSADAFVKQLLTLSPDASVMMMEFGQAAIPMTKFTSDPAELTKAINKIVARPGVGSVLGEALEASNKALAERPSGRRAIVSINLEPSDEQSFDNSKQIAESFGKSGAQLWSISVQRGGLKNSKRDVVLNDFAKASGGQRDFVIGISAVPDILKAYANALAMQYEVVFKRPESSKPAKVIQVGTRQGLKVHASSAAPK